MFMKSILSLLAVASVASVAVAAGPLTMSTPYVVLCCTLYSQPIIMGLYVIRTDIRQCKTTTFTWSGGVGECGSACTVITSADPRCS